MFETAPAPTGGLMFETAPAPTGGLMFETAPVSHRMAWLSAGLAVELMLMGLVRPVAAHYQDHSTPFWGSETVYGNYSGDILLGALFPVHQMGPSDSDCGRIQARVQCPPRTV